MLARSPLIVWGRSQNPRHVSDTQIENCQHNDFESLNQKPGNWETDFLPLLVLTCRCAVLVTLNTGNRFLENTRESTKLLLVLVLKFGHISASRYCTRNFFGTEEQPLKKTLLERKAILRATLGILGHSRSSAWNCTHDLAMGKLILGE